MTVIASDTAKSVLLGWSSQRPCLALMGEYSVGKSSLLNLLLGMQLLPARVTATRLPTVWMTYGADRKIETLDYDGTLSSISDFNGDFENLSEKFVIRCTLPCEILRNKDIIDTPGISDPNLVHDTFGLITPYIDFVIWCTAANQAWRQTESAAWASVPYHLQENSILAVTRIDLIGDQSDVKRLLKRCDREAGESFHAILPVSSKIARSKGDGSWQTSGVAALVEALEARTVVSEAHRAERRAREGVAQPLVLTQHHPDTAINNTSVDTPMRPSTNGIDTIPDEIAMASNDNASASSSQTRNAFGDDMTTPEALPITPTDLSSTKKDTASIVTQIRSNLAESHEAETPSPSEAELSSSANLVPHVKTGDISPSILNIKEENMSIDISALASIGGFIGACLVDSETGLMMASEGGGSLDLEAAGAANTEVVKAKLAAIEMLGLNDNIDDILITLGKQYHLIRPLEKTPTVFIYVALDKKSANLGMARVQVKNVEKTISM